MTGKIVSTILINGNEIRTIISKIFSKNNKQILANISVQHDGFFEGEFLNKENFNSSLISCISKAEATSKIHCQEAVVSIPSEFCTFEIVSSKLEFNNTKKITAKDMENLSALALSKLKTNEKTLIGCNPSRFLLDESEFVSDPLGKKTRNITSDFSFSFADNEFLTFLNKSLKAFGLKSATFVPLSLCEFSTLFENEDKNIGKLFVDFDSLSTTIIFGKINAIIKQVTISFGFAHIIANLQDEFDLSYLNCLEILEDCVLSVFPKNDEKLIFNNKLYSKSKIYDLCRSCCGGLAKQIAKLLIDFNLDGKETVFITGSGICELKGIKQILANETKRKIEFLTSLNPQFFKTSQSGLISLLEYSIKLKNIN